MQLDFFKSTNKKPDPTAKICKKCKELRPIEDYRLYRRATGDRNSRDSKCRQCSRHSEKIAFTLTLVSMCLVVAYCGKRKNNDTHTTQDVAMVEGGFNEIQKIT